MKSPYFSRTLTWIMMIALTVWLDSCKKDDSTPPTTTTSIEGTYKITALKSNPKVGGVYEDLLAAAPIVLKTTCMSDIKITFVPGGTVTTDNPTSCQNSAISPSIFTGIDGSSKWALNGSTLTITRADNTTTTYNVLKTGAVTQLQWQSKEDFLGTGTKTDYTFTMDLTKQ